MLIYYNLHVKIGNFLAVGHKEPDYGASSSIEYCSWHSLFVTRGFKCHLASVLPLPYEHLNLRVTAIHICLFKSCFIVVCMSWRLNYSLTAFWLNSSAEQRVWYNVNSWVFSKFSLLNWSNQTQNIPCCQNFCKRFTSSIIHHWLCRIGQIELIRQRRLNLDNLDYPHNDLLVLKSSTSTSLSVCNCILIVFTNVNSKQSITKLRLDKFSEISFSMLICDRYLTWQVTSNLIENSNCEQYSRTYL